MASAETRALAPQRGSVSIPPYLSVPYCAVCVQRHRFPVVKTFALMGAAAFAAGLAGASLLWFVDLPRAPLLVLAALVAFGLFGSVLWLVRARRTTVYVSAAREQGRQLVIFCPNDEWGRKLAERSHGRVETPARRMSWLAATGFVGAASTAGFVGLLFWQWGHGRVAVDNVSDHPIVFWLDGAAIAVVPPNLQRAEPPSFSATTGSHRIGWSREGASRPENDARVVLGRGRVLYNPGATACYWRVTSVYHARPEAALDDVGSVELMSGSEVYELGGIDDLFRESPEEVRLSNRTSRASRTAVFPDETCTGLLRRRCFEAASEFIDCAHTAMDESAYAACESSAASRCEAP